MTFSRSYAKKKSVQYKGNGRTLKLCITLFTPDTSGSTLHADAFRGPQITRPHSSGICQTNRSATCDDNKEGPRSLITIFWTTTVGSIIQTCKRESR